MMSGTNDGVDRMDEMMGGAFPAPLGDEMVRSTTTPDVGLDDGDLMLNSTTATCVLHHSDSEEEKENETASNNVDMMDETMGGAYPAPVDELVSSTVIVSAPRSLNQQAMDRSELERQRAPEIRERSRDILALTRNCDAGDQSDDDSDRSVGTTTAELARNGNNSSITNPGEPLVPPAGLNSKARPRNDSLNEDAGNIDPSQRPGAYTARGRPFGSRPSWHRRMSAHLAAPFRRGSSQSLILGELAEPSQEDEELRRRYEELQRIVNGAVTGTATVENNDAGDHDQNAAPSPSGGKERRLLIGAAFALLLVVGVILGVTFSLTTNNDNDSPSIDSVVTPTQSPAPTKAPTACNSLDCLTKLLLQNEVSDAEALQDDSSPQFLALRWLANNDPGVLDLDSMPDVILVERYVLAVLYFATSAEGGSNVLNFLTASSVCEWKGVFCNGDDLIVALLLSKSKHGEVFSIQNFALTHLFFFIQIQ
jgi:hypothetical protein